MQFGIEYIENFLATMVFEKEKKHFEETQKKKKHLSISLYLGID
jgi:hypothetical protein